MNRFARVAGLVCMGVLFGSVAWGAPVRVKDVVTIEGADSVELVGYGLVIGLNGSGDGRSITYTRQSMRNLLERMGLTVSDDRIRPRNVASVIVTARVTPWERAGATVDVTVSSIGDASSLAGGLLLLTELRGPDGKLYATGQGAISVGGFDVTGFSGSRVRRNYTTTGRVPEGARIVAGPTFERTDANVAALLLDEPDFTQADRIAEALNAFWGGATVATPEDAGRIALDLTQLPDAGNFAKAMADLDQVTVQPAVVAKVVINERTGTLVAGGDIRLQPTTLSHGNLNVRIETTRDASQPPPFSGGATTVVQNDQLDVEKSGTGGVVSLPENTTADELAIALNALGVEPRDLISIFQALKEAGSLPAKMEIL